MWAVAQGLGNFAGLTASVSRLLFMHDFGQGSHQSLVSVMEVVASVLGVGWHDGFSMSDAQNSHGRFKAGKVEKRISPRVPLSDATLKIKTPPAIHEIRDKTRRLSLFLGRNFANLN